MEEGWRVLRDLKEAEEDMEQDQDQELLQLTDLVQKVTGCCANNNEE